MIIHNINEGSILHYSGVAEMRGTSSKIGGLGPLVPMSAKGDETTESKYHSFWDLHISISFSTKMSFFIPLNVLRRSSDTRSSANVAKRYATE